MRSVPCWHGWLGQSPQQQLAAVAAAGLFKHRREMALHGARAEAQPGGDAAVAVPLQQQGKHPLFSGADRQQALEAGH